MKVCPQCSTQYSDDSLSYCLQDGTPLRPGDGGETPTVVMGETDTVVRQRWNSEVTRVGPAARQGSRMRSRTGLAVVLTALAMLVLFGIVAVAAYLVYRKSGSETSSNIATNISIPNSNAPPRTPVLPTPSPNSSTPSPTPSNANVPASTPTTPVNDPGNTRNEITRLVNSWKSQMESHDLNGTMTNYADTLDYYNKRNVSAGSVRADKARAFGLYRSMDVNISNLDVTPAPSGDTATATFDKEWTFTGAGTSQGKVRSQLIFRRSNGRWLITSERDLKVYYTR